MVPAFDSFQVQGVLARPPGGPVYRAYHPLTGLMARVFTLDPLHAREEATAREFSRRRQTAALLGRHPGIWPLLEAGSLEGIEYYAIGQPGGATLLGHLCLRAVDALPGEETPSRGAVSRAAAGAPTLCGRGKAWEPGEAAEPEPLPYRASAWTIRAWLSEIASAVSFAHENGIVLGTLSSETVWIRPDGGAMLIPPYAEARAKEEDRALPSESSPDRAAFLAPEQLLGRTVGPPADIYALGTLLFWLLGGEFPQARHQEAARIGRYLPLPPLKPSLDAALRGICETATAVQPSARFRNADLLRAALLASPEDLAVATERAHHAARHTLIRGIPRAPAELPALGWPERRTSRFLRWLHALLYA